MKIKIYLFALMSTCLFAGCNEPTEPVSDVKEFPKKHLIEEFTGQTCGYCPDGMKYVHEFMDNSSNYVLVLHHYGYRSDHFSVAGCSQITNALSVSGAPNVAINRSVIHRETKDALITHPRDLVTTDKSQFGETTYASIIIDNQYNKDTRELQVHLSGEVHQDATANLKMTVLVKESGMMDFQDDYTNTFEGWQEFRHADAVRAYLTHPMGDAVSISDKHYIMDLSLSLDSQWVAENCMVVAFLTEDFRPVIQVEEAPVVAGSKGGADIEYGGITPVPVADYYPEPGATIAPSDYTTDETQIMSNTVTHYMSNEEKRVNQWTIMTVNEPQDGTLVNGTPAVALATIFVFTSQKDTVLPTGSYPINSSQQAGTVFAGNRNDQEQTLDGSRFYFASVTFIQQEVQYYPLVSWLLVDGQLIITPTGWQLEGHTLNGSSLKLEGSSPIQNRGKATSIQRRMPAKFNLQNKSLSQNP